MAARHMARRVPDDWSSGSDRVQEDAQSSMGEHAPRRYRGRHFKVAPAELAPPIPDFPSPPTLQVEVSPDLSADERARLLIEQIMRELEEESAPKPTPAESSEAIVEVDHDVHAEDVDDGSAPSVVEIDETVADSFVGIKESAEPEVFVDEQGDEFDEAPEDIDEPLDDRIVDEEEAYIPSFEAVSAALDEPDVPDMDLDLDVPDMDLDLDEPDLPIMDLDEPEMEQAVEAPSYDVASAAASEISEEMLLDFEDDLGFELDETSSLGSTLTLGSASSPDSTLTLDRERVDGELDSTLTMNRDHVSSEDALDSTLPIDRKAIREATREVMTAVGETSGRLSVQEQWPDEEDDAVEYRMPRSEMGMSESVPLIRLESNEIVMRDNDKDDSIIRRSLAERRGPLAFFERVGEFVSRLLHLDDR